MDTSAYLRTGEMAKYIGRSTAWLKRNKDKIFKKGIHYFQPEGEREPFWCVSKIEAWIRGEDSEISSIIEKVVE